MFDRMKRTYFHGTSADNLKAILRDGLNPDNDKKIWSCSYRGVYMWSPDAFVSSGDCEEENKNDFTREQAYSSAQMGLATAKSGKCVVFQLEIEEDELEQDFSCENMTGAFVCNRVVTRSEIKEVCISPDLSLLKGYFIALAMGRDLFAGTFSKLEIQIGEAFKNSEIYIEMGDYPLSPCKMKKV